MTQRALSQLQRKLKRLSITHDQVAAEARVTRPMVSHVFHGRSKSRPVVSAAERLIQARLDAARELISTAS